MSLVAAARVANLDDRYVPAPGKVNGESEADRPGACDQHLRTYTRTGTAVASIISELPGERAEALFVAMAAFVPTAGEQCTSRQGQPLVRSVPAVTGWRGSSSQTGR